ncbi:MAG: DUF262 domain-containing protein, partial [Muribaculaceae bacterium]|nr:DUF262 domain-containing protein [Muribaculaceae bacterium]
LAMKTSSIIFGNDAFRKRTDIGDRRKPINKALFEVQSVLFSRLDDARTEALRRNGDLYRQKFIALNRDEAFRYAISSGTGQRDSVIRRFTEINRIIQETITADV